MAITQVANPSSVPSAVADYEAQNAHISAFNNIVNNQPFILTNSGGTGLPAIKVGTYIQYGGNLYVVDTGDYAITGTPVNGNNYIRLSGSTTLTAEWVQDISSYVWNEVYGYKESGSYFLLPYLVVKDGTSYEKYSMGAITAQYKMNQNVRTTDDVQFADLKIDGVDYKGSKDSASAYTTIIDTGTTLKFSTGEGITLSLVLPRGLYTCQLTINSGGSTGNIYAQSYYYSYPGGTTYFDDHGDYIPGGSSFTHNDTMDVSEKGYGLLRFVFNVGSAVTDATIRLVVQGKSPPVEDMLGNFLYAIGSTYRVYNNTGHFV